MIQYLLFGASKLLKIIDITKRIGNFFKLPIQLLEGISYPELALRGYIFDGSHNRNLNAYQTPCNHSRQKRQSENVPSPPALGSAKNPGRRDTEIEIAPM